MENKCCTECKIEKPASDFRKDNRRGIPRSKCRQCERARRSFEKMTARKLANQGEVVKETTEKQCITCAEIKPIDSFRKQPKSENTRNSCRACEKIAYGEWKRKRETGETSPAKNLFKDETQKECSKCHEIKPLDNFRIDYRYNNRRSDCGACESIRYKERYHNDPDFSLKQMMNRGLLLSNKIANATPEERDLMRYEKLLEVAFDNNVKVLFTFEEFRVWLHSPNLRCYASGELISDWLDKMPFAYFMDRIGNPAFGGDGKKGGDYHLDNIRPCLFIWNYYKGLRRLSADELETELSLFRSVQAVKHKADKIKKFLKKLVLID